MGRQHPSRAAQVALGIILTLAGFAARGEFAFATREEGAAILGTRDDYVRSSSLIERKAKLRTNEQVSEEKFAAFMAESALGWDDAQRQRVEAVLEPLQKFLDGLRLKPDRKIYLVRAADRLEDGMPHTRAAAVILPESVVRDAPAGALAFLLAHEVFHVVSRDEPKVREELYAAIGFLPCAKMEVPRGLGNLRITNPDAPHSRHSIRVRWRGQYVEALPFLHFTSAEIDPREGFKGQLRATWLLVERALDGCRMRAPAEGVPIGELDGLWEQIGLNTRYVLHPEEVLADNFAYLYLTTVRSGMPPVKSPEILEKMNAILRKP